VCYINTLTFTFLPELLVKVSGKSNMNFFYAVCDRPFTSGIYAAAAAAAAAKRD